MNLKNSIFACISFLFTLSVKGQMGPNFTITDGSGQVHRLYEDYLDKGKIVVLKIFFADCPPCNSSAPGFQSQYAQYGSGTQDVQFMCLSNKSWDDNAKVNGFKSRNGLTMPVAGAQGGSVEAQALYTNGTFGPFYGTPHYLLIAPDRTVHDDISYGEMATIITQIRNSTSAPSTPVQLSHNLGSALPSGVQVMMKPQNEVGPIVNLSTATNNTLRFDYPSSQVPLMSDPVIYIESTAPALNSQIRTADIIEIRKHILGISILTDPNRLLAAELNNDGRLSVSDIVELRKVILGINTQFPNGIPSYKMNPPQVGLSVSGNQMVQLAINIVKMGNIVD